MTRSTDGAILETATTAVRRATTATRLEWSARADGLTPLVRLAQRGDSAAFERLVEMHLDAAYRLAYAILRSEADARDAVQEAFVAAWRRLRGLRDPARFGSWLDRIVVNACRMAIRRRNTVRVREIHVVDLEAYGEIRSRHTMHAPDDTIADADLVRRGLVRLSVDQRAVLVLHHGLDRPIDEIAEVLGVPVGTVKWRLHAAREALRRAVLEELR